MKLTDAEFNKEKVRLKYVVNEIDNQLGDAGKELFTEEKDLKEFQKMMWESSQEFDSGEMNTFIYDNEVKINTLERKAGHYRVLDKVRNNPYFGMIRFNNEDIYIGIKSIKKDLDYLVYDWRAPICSMFYDYGLGKSSYESPDGIEVGDITRKRQYKIENASLKAVFDTNLNIDDEMLQEVLSQTSSDKMKDIVNTIQVEQNMVIRDTTTKNIIVQGVAGSGKTSVALHRIAYLLYKMENLTSSNVLILSPNNVFTEYISDVLPSLGEKNTLESTYHKLVSKFISEYERVESYSSFVERYYKDTRQDNELIKFKLSDEIIPLIEDYCKYFTKASRFLDNLEYKKKVIPMSELNELLYKRYDNKPLFERVDLIAEKINNSYFKGTKGDFIKIRSHLLKIANFTSDMKKIYKNFYTSAIFLNSYKMPFRENELKKNIDANVINYDDATIFMYMKFLLTGFPYQVYVREVIIDEAQDYTYLQYKILHKIFKNAGFTILGDVNQSVNPFYKHGSLEELLPIFDQRETKYVELNKTYRSSPEIIEYANKVLNLNQTSAIRRSSNAPVIKRSMKDLKYIGKDIVYLKKKYKSIAIITKSIEEAKILMNALKDKYDKISLIDINTEKFNKQLVVAPAYGVKGLEFDSVIIINNFDYDKYLYYVAVTRCQHELIVYE